MFIKYRRHLCPYWPNRRSGKGPTKRKLCRHNIKDQLACCAHQMSFRKIFLHCVIAQLALWVNHDSAFCNDTVVGDKRRKVGLPTDGWGRSHPQIGVSGKSSPKIKLPLSSNGCSLSAHVGSSLDTTLPCRFRLGKKKLLTRRISGVARLAAVSASFRVQIFKTAIIW